MENITKSINCIYVKYMSGDHKRQSSRINLASLAITFERKRKETEKNVS